MIYVVDEKALAFDVKEIGEHDRFLVFCRDLSKPVFTGEQVKEILAKQQLMPVDLLEAASKEEQMFWLGHWAALDQVTLVNLALPVPAAYKDKVAVVQTCGKKAPAKKTGRSRKRPVKAAEPAVSSDGESDRQSVKESKQETSQKQELTKPEQPESGHDASAAGSGDKNSESKPDVCFLLSPKETDEEILASLSEDEKELYDLIGVRSSDIGFSWPTSVLMSKILITASETDDVSDLESAIRASFSNGDLLFGKCRPYLQKIYELSREVS